MDAPTKPAEAGSRKLEGAGIIAAIKASGIKAVEIDPENPIVRFTRRVGHQGASHP